MNTHTTTEDREAFMAADFPLTLSDGVVINVLDDPDGYLSAGEFEDVESTRYVGVTIVDPATGASDSLWGTGVPDHCSGHDARAMLWSHVVGGYYELLPTVRRLAAQESAECAHWAARDVVTVA